MAMDNLPADMNRSQFIPGHGFGLGMAVLTDPQAFGSMGSAGQYWWWGAASTRIIIDPSEEMVIIFMTQLFPMNGPLVFQFEDMVFQSIID